MKIPTSFLVISGATAFVANILAIVNALSGTKLHFGTTSISLPSITLGPIGSANIAFVILFYFTFTLGILVLEGTYLSILAFTVLPTLLFVLWGFAFFPDTPWPALALLLLSSVARSWWLVSKGRHRDYESWRKVAYWRSLGYYFTDPGVWPEYSRHLGHMCFLASATSIGLFPLTALILMYIGHLQMPQAWLAAGIASGLSILTARRAADAVSSHKW